ncbi:MAG: SDR family oxidoreductase [Acidobacteriota bacterium]
MITGGASGLGRELARRLSGRGNLCLLDRDADRLAQVAEELSAGRESTSLLHYAVDVTDASASLEAVQSCCSHFGRLDALFLCAGQSMWARADEIQDLSIFRRLVEVNYLGAVHCIIPALPALRASRGSIVAISSLQGDLGLPLHSGYSAAKHALNGFLESLWFELGDEVHILTVMPGWIRGTRLREHALTGTGQPPARPRRHSKESVSVEECAELVIQAWENRKSRLYIPGKLALLPWLFRLSPRLVRRLLSRAIAQQQ